ncbi:MAG: citrate lyase holo-[acyl-carrier protein] synthase [Candidatus Bruticola sp.]
MSYTVLPINGPAIELEELLKSRDNRCAFQQYLLKQRPVPLVSFMVNMPGPVKRSFLAEKLHALGCSELKKALGSKIIWSEVRRLNTGFEGYFAVNISPYELKRQTCSLEDSHPLGRLWDFDVHTLEGQISRSQLNLAPRLCLICSKPAPLCARSRAHSLPELLNCIGAMANQYFGEQ